MANNEVQKIIILTTGGTIEKTYDESDGTLFNRETVIKNRIHQRLRLPYTHIDIKSLMTKDSLDMTEQDREVILQAVKRFSEYNYPIVILHGTDTMQLTAEFVAKEFDTHIPIIFTGAMKPLGFEDSDAIQNVNEALIMAKVVKPGVYISFHNRLFDVPGGRKNLLFKTFEAF
jgi:L-asparaginase